MKRNKNWFWIIIAMFLTFLVYLIAVFLLEYLVPFSRNVKWIENSSRSYYLANSWIEEWLWLLSQEDVWFSSWKVFNSQSSDYSFLLSASDSKLPPVWEWNSDIDNDWNKISPWKSLSMEVWNQMVNWGSFTGIYFRVPNFNQDSSSNQVLIPWTWAIINWQLSSLSDTLNASGSHIVYDNLNTSSLYTWNNMWNLSWFDLAWNSKTLSNFYWTNCWLWSWCILKVSIINDLKITDPGNPEIPFLERQAVFPSAIPTQLVRISWEWKSYWFKKDIDIKVPQPSIIDAFDFTVFQ